jgi:hypothetical protein
MVWVVFDSADEQTQIFFSILTVLGIFVIMIGALYHFFKNR